MEHHSRIPHRFGEIRIAPGRRSTMADVYAIGICSCDMQRKTLDARMESFADSCGVIPVEANRLLDHEARYHAAEWIRRLLGKGIACDYVIGYALGDSWWTFCFDRRSQDEVPSEDTEVWRIEAYDSIGRGWSDTFKYWPHSDRWQLLVTHHEHGGAAHLPVSH